MQIIQVPIIALKLTENNPRKISRDQMQRLVKSMQEDPDFIKNRPVLVNQVNGEFHVYAGNQRVKAAKKLRWKQIYCIVEENLSEELVKKRLIKDNKTFGEFDWDILSEDYNLDFLVDCGFDPEEIKFPGLEEELKKEEKERRKNKCPECGHEF